MITLLLPEDVSRHWDIIKFAIEESLPPTVSDHPDKMNNILAGLLSGKAQCWISHSMNGQIRVFDGVVVTKILYDDVSNTKSLLIYCLYGYNKVPKESWLQGLQALAKWAISKGCSSIVGYSDNPAIFRVVERFKGEAKYTFIRIPL